MKKKLLLLTTGGTIACTPGVHGYTPTITGNEILAYVPEAEAYAEITVRSIFNKDSSNMNPGDWMKIADAIYRDHDRYQGIVVLHGTDTMAYSASAVGFMTMGIEIPIVFTGSQLPVGAPDSDGPGNLRDALYTACFWRRKGVWIVFHGRILAGCRASKMNSTELDAFDCVNGEPAGWICGSGFRKAQLPQQNWQEPYLWRRKVENGVLFLKVTPGMDAGLLKLVEARPYRAVILEAFGLGGLPVENEELLESITELCRRKILVAVTTQCSRGACDMTVYEVGRTVLREGAVSSGLMTKEALLAKIMWGLGITHDVEALKELLFHNFCGEWENRKER